MDLREATLHDIEQMYAIRCSVKENKLSDPARITWDDYKEYITTRGKGWVCVIDAHVVGFATADLRENNIWALFVHPDHERKGIGGKLHELMLNWYFQQTKDTVWLSTDPGTKAADFYKRHGWKEMGAYGSAEIRLEMSYEEWCSFTLK